MTGLRAFASDNYAPVHPDVWAALAAAEEEWLDLAERDG